MNKIAAPIRRVTLRSPSGAEAEIIDYGASLRDLHVPKADGSLRRVVLGLQNLEDYPAHSPHMGAVAGRFANRIARGRFTLDGQDYQLPLNENGRHTLHGGDNGFGKRRWTFVEISERSATLALVSPDGDAGYPGTVRVWCRYSLTENAMLRVEFSATTDAPTVLNLAHHPYFKLDDEADVLSHRLQIDSDLVLPTDADLIPDGSVASVTDTPFDFRRTRPIRVASGDASPPRYDCNFLLRRDCVERDEASGLELARAATLTSEVSGMALEIWTTQPCLQLYDGAKLAVSVPGLGGTNYSAFAGVVLEPQHAPNSPNLQHLRSTVLRPGVVYRHVNEYRLFQY